jgi:hypothetical protein
MRELGEVADLVGFRDLQEEVVLDVHRKLVDNTGKVEQIATNCFIIG